MTDPARPRVDDARGSGTQMRRLGCRGAPCTLMRTPNGAPPSLSSVHFGRRERGGDTRGSDARGRAKHRRPARVSVLPRSDCELQASRPRRAAHAARGAQSLGDRARRPAPDATAHTACTFSVVRAPSFYAARSSPQSQPHPQPIARARLLRPADDGPEPSGGATQTASQYVGMQAQGCGDDGPWAVRRFRFSSLF